MHTRHIILLLDIDDTLIDFDSSTTVDTVYWNGINSDSWKIYLNTLKKLAKEKGIEIHYGIATYKKAPGDLISGVVLKQLEDVLDPKLIFFTGNQSKTTHALDKARAQIQAEYKSKVPETDVWLFDDDEMAKTHATDKKYSFAKADFQGLAPSDQRVALCGLFKPLYENLGLLEAMPTMSSLSEEEKSRTKKLIVRREPIKHGENLGKWLLQKPQIGLSSFTEEELSNTQSLDEDDESGLQSFRTLNIN
ncbi:MAG: hypothetical protein ABI597_07865 [Gammaproteobacteria bacterium]